VENILSGPNSKKSDPTELSDYIPIIILPVLSKTIEIARRDQLVVFVDNFSLFGLAVSIANHYTI
jgi:hypothetical protein